MMFSGVWKLGAVIALPTLYVPFALEDIRSLAIEDAAEKRLKKIRQQFVKEETFREDLIQHRLGGDLLEKACSADVTISSKVPSIKHSVMAWEVFVAEMWQVLKQNPFLTVTTKQRVLCKTKQRVEESGLPHWAKMGFNVGDNGHRPMLERALVRCKVMKRKNACDNLAMAEYLGIKIPSGPKHLVDASNEWTKNRNKEEGLALAEEWINVLRKN